MKSYKGIILDLDGTLLNTIEDLGDSINHVLNEFGFQTLSYEECKLKIGGGFKGLIKKSFPEDSDEDTINSGVHLFEKVYDKNYLKKTKAYEGIMDLLEALEEREIKLAINSNKRNSYTNNLVEKHFEGIKFYGVYGERKGIKIKPDPVAALEIAENMNLDPRDILYIGDSKPDMLTAKNAGMDSVGVLWGFRDREELEKYGATYIVEKPREILDLL